MLVASFAKRFVAGGKAAVIRTAAVKFDSDKKTMCKQIIIELVRRAILTDSVSHIFCEGVFKTPSNAQVFKSLFFFENLILVQIEC